MASEHAARARALVGARFRPQGHDPRYGLDCVGLVVAVYRLEHHCIRRNYRLRGDHLAELRAAASTWFRAVPRRAARPGDVLLCRVALDQMHLAIRTDAGFVHADAGLRRVVETPGAVPWPVAAVLRRRLRPSKRK